MTACRIALISALTILSAACSEDAQSPNGTATSASETSSAVDAEAKASPRAPTRFLTLADVGDAQLSEGGGLPRDEYGRPFTYALLGETVPEFTLPMHGGGEFSSSDLAGKWSVIDFWGLWCPDCLIDAPYASALRTALNAAPDTQFVSLHTPANPKRIDRAFGKWGSLDAYFEDTDTSYPVVVDTDAAVGQAFKLGWVPTYLLIAPDLTIHAFRTDLHVDDKDGIKPVVQQISELRAAYTPTVD